MTVNEKKLQERLEVMGYRVLHRGLPDFLVTKDGHLAFIEHKSRGDGVSQDQKKAIETLRAHGIPAIVVKENDTLETLEQSLELFAQEQAKRNELAARLISLEDEIQKLELQLQAMEVEKQHRITDILAGRETLDLQQNLRRILDSYVSVQTVLSFGQLTAAFGGRDQKLSQLLQKFTAELEEVLKMPKYERASL